MYGVTRYSFFNFKYCHSCIFNNDVFKDSNIVIIEFSFEIEKLEAVSVISIRDHYCGLCNVRLFFFKESDGPTRENEMIVILNMILILE